MRLSNHVLACVVSLLAACGGGGGGGEGNPAPTVQDIDAVATVTYRASNLTATATYDPWTAIRLEPTITGLPATASRTFIVTNLPPGVTHDSATGVISGLPTGDVGRRELTILMRSPDYTGSVDTRFLLKVDILEWLGTMHGGFSVLNGDNIIGNVGVAGEVHLDVSLTNVSNLTFQRLQPLPAGTTVVYGVTASTAVGATMNSATGVVSWNPPATGRYSTMWFADVTCNGVTRRVTGTLAFDIR